VDLTSCCSLETDVLAMLVLDQYVRGFDFLLLIGQWRLTFLPCLCWISMYMDLTSCCPLETDVPVVLVLGQELRGFDFLLLIGD